MRFFKRSKERQKTVLVISDLHLGAGTYVQGKKNDLEDFHFDRELVEFLEYYSSGDFAEHNLELVINGDLLDFLAVLQIPVFEDEFWAESSSVRKLELIKDGHPEVFDALEQFLLAKNKKLIYIIGNHDAEMILPKVRQRFLEFFQEDVRGRVEIRFEEEIYRPHPDICILHGHQFEPAHYFSSKRNIVQSGQGEYYFLPPWGSYYVTQIINKYKQERNYINFVRPIKNFLIHGLLFDTFFTVRFMLANLYFLFMAKVLNPLIQLRDWKLVKGRLGQEFELFPKVESLTARFYDQHPDCRLLVIGHTHAPEHRSFDYDSEFINTGTWAKMVNLDLGKINFQTHLTYAQITLYGKQAKKGLRGWDAELLEWHGRRQFPYQEYV